MSNIEQQLIRAGAVLVKCNRHKVYEVQGRRFTLSHSHKANDTRDRHKPMLHFLNKIKAGQ